jgi:hypothetical protein
MPANRIGGDRILPATKILSAVIIPFLVVAFVLLYFWPSPDDTGRLFAWRIVPEFTAMMLASVYLGGSYFFVRVITGKEWHSVAGGFVPVGIFASLMGVATLLHWDRFVHGNVAFWLWAGLYMTTPFLVFAVWLINRREAVPPSPDDLFIGALAVPVIGGMGIAAAATSLFLFVFPQTAIAVWPWTLTELTSRTMGAIFALGIGAVGIFFDRRWSSARILLQVAGFMLVLIFISVLRSIGDFDTTRPLTWALAAGLVGMSAGLAILYAQMTARSTKH